MLVWIALPQFRIAPVVATIRRFVDARLTMAFGPVLIDKLKVSMRWSRCARVVPRINAAFCRHL